MKLRYPLLIAFVCAILGIFRIGQNVAAAQQLANLVVTQDTANQPTSVTLKQLSDYIAHHMGASQTVFLAAGYARAQAAATVPATTSGQVYHDAQAACVSRTTAVNQANCVQSYLASHSTPGSSAATPQPTAVSKSSYTYTYVSPRWTPDPAGLLLLFAGLAVAASGIFALVRRR